MRLLILLFEYFWLAVLSYIFLSKLNLKFFRDNEKADLTESQKKMLLIIMSIFWIISLPRLYFNSKKKE